MTAVNEVGSRNAEVGKMGVECGSRNAEVGKMRQKTDGRGQETEDNYWNSDWYEFESNVEGSIL
jgi:hypothetical protein